MYGMTPYTFPGAQAAPTAGFPALGQQLTPQQLTPQQMMPQQLMPQQMMPQQMMPQQMMGKMMGGPMLMGAPAAEESYVENILRMNQGKVATVYTTNENNPQWAAKIFKGRVENAARDHVVLSDPESGQRSIILMVNIDYITFDEPLRYEPGVYGR